MPVKVKGRSSVGSSLLNRISYTSLEPQSWHSLAFILQVSQVSDSMPMRRQRSSCPSLRPMIKPTASTHVVPQVAQAYLFLSSCSVESLFSIS